MYRWNNFHGNTTNLRGLLLTELPGGELSQNARLVQGLVIVSSLTVLGIVGWTWLRWSHKLQLRAQSLFLVLFKK